MFIAMICSGQAREITVDSIDFCPAQNLAHMIGIVELSCKHISPYPSSNDSGTLCHSSILLLEGLQGLGSVPSILSDCVRKSVQAVLALQ